MHPAGKVPAWARVGDGVQRKDLFVHLYRTQVLDIVHSPGRVQGTGALRLANFGRYPEHFAAGKGGGCVAACRIKLRCPPTSGQCDSSVY